MACPNMRRNSIRIRPQITYESLAQLNDPDDDRCTGLNDELRNGSRLRIFLRQVASIAFEACSPTRARLRFRRGSARGLGRRSEGSIGSISGTDDGSGANFLFIRLHATRYRLLLASAASAAPTQGATASDWVALNTTLSGRLQQGVPLALPCFDNLDGKPSNRNTTACANVLADFTQADFRKDFEGASMLVSKICSLWIPRVTLKSDPPAAPMGKLSENWCGV